MTSVMATSSELVSSEGHVRSRCAQGEDRNKSVNPGGLCRNCGPGADENLGGLCCVEVMGRENRRTRQIEPAALTPEYVERPWESSAGPWGETEEPACGPKTNADCLPWPEYGPEPASHLQAQGVPTKVGIQGRVSGLGPRNEKLKELPNGWHLSTV